MINESKRGDHFEVKFESLEIDKNYIHRSYD